MDRDAHDAEIERAAAALYRELREYDFFSHWEDDAIMRQALWAAECHLDRIHFMRLLLWAAGRYMTQNHAEVTDLVAAVMGGVQVANSQYDLPF